MLVVTRAWRKHRPPNQKLGGARSFLIDQKLHLHVDPALVLRQAANVGYVAEIYALRLHFEVYRRLGGMWRTRSQNRSGPGRGRGRSSAFRSRPCSVRSIR